MHSTCISFVNLYFCLLFQSLKTKMKTFTRTLQNNDIDFDD